MFLVVAVYGAPGVLWLVLVYNFLESAACACAKSSSACCFLSRLSRLFKDLVYLLYRKKIARLRAGSAGSGERIFIGVLVSAGKSN